MQTASETIATRTNTHGDFEANSEIYATLDALARDVPPRFRYAMDGIIIKLVRIFSGKADTFEHWLDIEGYARLGKGLTTEAKSATTTP